MNETTTKPETRTRKPTEKQKLADQASEEVMKKKLKITEDKLKKFQDSNKTLKNEVKTLRRKPAPPSVPKRTRRTDEISDDHSSEDSESGSASDSDIAHMSDDSNLLFSSAQIQLKSRRDPDTATKGKHRPHVKKKARHLPDRHLERSPPQDDPEPDASSPPVGDSTPAPSRGKGKNRSHDTKDQRLAPQHQNRSLTRDEPDADGGNDPPGDLSQPQSPPRKPHDARPTTSKNIVLPSATVPPRPWPRAPLAPGVDAKSPQTANKDFEVVVAAMLTEAEHRFECLLFVENAYPTLETQMKWSMECWDAVCLEFQNYFDLSKTMMRLIKDRCSHGRGIVLQRIRPVLDDLFEMAVQRPAVVAKNKEIARRSLTNNAFYFANGEPGRRRFESKIVLRALQRAFFTGQKSPAATNPKKFDPVPLPCIALVCTIIEHCLREWESGKHVPVNLDEATDGSRYRVHVANAASWEELDQKKTTEIRRHLSNKLFAYCNMNPKEVATTGFISQETLDAERAALAARSIGLDSDSEDDS